jgi:hypothetical protein
MSTANLDQCNSGVSYPGRVRVAAREDWGPVFNGIIAVIVFDGKKGMYLGKVEPDGDVSLELVSWSHIRDFPANLDWLRHVNDLIVVDQQVGLTPSQCRSKRRIVEGLFKKAQTHWFRVQTVRIRRSKLTGAEQTFRQMLKAYRLTSEAAVQVVRRLCRKAEQSGKVERLVI